jgi:transcription elongation factor GreB
MTGPADDALDEDDDEKEEQPKPKGPLYMTPTGWRVLKDELEHLGTVERPKVVQGVADAAAEGDRSENAEYIYGKRRLRQIDSRMRFLRKIVENAVLVDPAIDRGDKVFFGATVVLENDDGERVTYQLVGQHETNAETGRISYLSPVGAALMRKSVDDEVVIDTPRGRRKVVIVEVLYR